MRFFENFFQLFIDMAPYMMLGLLLVGIIHEFFNKEKVIKHISKKGIKSVTIASIIGVPLPLCSCSVLPTAIELKKQGSSDGAVVSFLTSTPQTGVDSIAVTYGLMGGFFAIFRPIVAFITGITGGFFTDLFIKDTIAVTPDNDCDGCCDCQVKIKKGFMQKSIDAFKYAFVDFLGEISVHFLIGLLISALISTLIPEGFFVKSSISSGILSYIIMVAVGLPMYVCATSSIPIAISIISSGFSVGAAFVFLFAGPVTNAATITVLIKKIGKRATTIYIANAIVMAIIFGYICDILVNKYKITISPLQGYHDENTSIFMLILSALFAFLLVYSFVKSKLKGK